MILFPRISAPTLIFGGYWVFLFLNTCELHSYTKQTPPRSPNMTPNNIFPAETLGCDSLQDTTQFLRRVKAVNCKRV